MIAFWDTMKSDRIEVSVMKQVAGILLLVAVFLSACSNSRNLPAPNYTQNTLSVYSIDEDYLVVMEDYNDHGVVQREVTFSTNRKCKKVKKLVLIPNYDVDQLIGMPFDELAELCGQPHCDIGSGLYIPSYVTEDAYLLCLTVHEEVVTEAIKRDLFTGEIVQRTG